MAVHPDIRQSKVVYISYGCLNFSSIEGIKAKKVPDSGKIRRKY